jgi:hypothetical protein
MKKLAMCLILVYISVNGQRFDIKNMPPGYENTTIITSENISHIAAVITGDIWSAYPDFADKYKDKTELQKEIFLESNEAESIKTLLRLQESNILKGRCIVQADFGEEYNTQEQAFMVKGWSWFPSLNSEEGNAYYLEKGKHVFEEIWFDYAPLEVRGTGWVQAYLVLRVKDKALALEIERQRDNLKVWVGFRLTGNIREIVRPPLPQLGFAETEGYLEGKDVVVMLVNKEKGEVVWWRKYAPSPSEK